ncbi:TIGR01777 family protein [bacterium]|nr:TIGR01777 family protein [bacterium]
MNSKPLPHGTCLDIVAIILIAGGSGLIGTELQTFLRSKGHEVRILTRTPDKRDPFQFAWDIKEKSIDSNALSNVDAVINLNGANVLQGRWTDARKKVLRNSRIDATELLVEEIKRGGNRVKHFINASAMGYYGNQGDSELTESDPAGSEFLAKLCQDWEQAALQLNSTVPVSILRIGLYLHPKGGVYSVISKLAKFYIASAFGTGKQWLGYTHRDEFNAVVLGIIENRVPDDVYNITGKDPQTMNKFVKAIVEHKNKKVILPNIPAFLLKLVLGELSGSLLHSHQVVSDKLQSVYDFKYDNIEEALEAFEK